MPEKLPMDLKEAEAWPAKVWNLQSLPGRQGLAQAGARSSLYAELRKCKGVKDEENCHLSKTCQSHPRAGAPK